MYKCHKCQRKIYSKFTYCPDCGTTLKVSSRSQYLMFLSESAQANRIEVKLDKILKHLKIDNITQKREVTKDVTNKI